MWIPRDADDIEAAAARGDLTETSSFEAKRELPTSTKHNVRLATDVAAMATDGGVLLVGIAEDENGEPTVPRPAPLAGAKERVDNIVRSSVAEVPYIEVRPYPTTDDPSIGYIVIVVPRSPRAPHQVTVGGDLRFYGRGATGNRPLAEGEVARLYQRRQASQVDRDARLREVVAYVRFATPDDAGAVYAFAQPVPPDQGLWDRAVARAGGQGALREALAKAAAQPGGEAAGLTGQVHWHQQGADVARLSSSYERQPEPRMTKYLVDIAVNIDGRGVLFGGGAALTHRPDPNGPNKQGRLFINEAAIAYDFAAFLAFMAALLELADYHGPVDVGVLVTGLNGGISMARVSRMQFAFFDSLPTYNDQTYSRTEQLSAASELDNPEAITLRILGRLFETTAGSAFDPFAI
jgi:hypothetical protein